MGFIDLDEKRNTASKEENSIYVLFTTLAVFQYVLIHNLISKSYWHMQIETLVAMCMFFYGSLRF